MKVYNPEKSILICNSPKGTLYKKKTRALEYYLYRKTSGEPEITSLSWVDAKEICRTYGTRDTFNEFFTVRGKDTNPKKGKSPVYLDSLHRMKAIRNASMLNMNVTQYVKYLIDMHDNNDNFNRKKSRVL